MRNWFALLSTLTIFSLFSLYLYTTFDFYNCMAPMGPVENNFSRFQAMTGEERNFTNIFDYMEKGSDYVANLPRPPYILGSYKIGPRFLGNKSCAPFPTFYSIKFSNAIWQLQEQTNWTFHLFGAYWDIRETNQDAPSIRILGMVNQRDETIGENYCQIWFANKSEPLISKVNSYKYVWVKQWGNYNDVALQPYLINCPMPEGYINDGSIPRSVSLVPTPCTPATNNLRIHFEKPKEKKMFAVCVKGMDFISPDWSTRLVEWIELLHIFGVHKIYFYDLAVHPSVKKVFKYYEKLNKIQVSPLTNAGGLPNEAHLRHAYLKKKITPKRQHELIPYNDCLYRNMYKYKYISLLDIDEIIVPHNGASTWYDLVDILEKSNTENYSPYFVFANVHFVSDIKHSDTGSDNVIPEYLYMLQHTTRNSGDAGKGSGIKCFHRPENILTLHNHFPTSCISKCSKKFVSHSDGFLHHYSYRGTYKGTRKGNITVTYVTDETLWRWKDDLIVRSNKAFFDLGLIKVK